MLGDLMEAEVWQAGHILSTSAGMFGLWQPERFEGVRSLDAWEDEVSDDSALSLHIEAGAFVPINVGGDGTFQISVRNAPRNTREERYTLVSSEPYLLVSKGSLALGGLENVGSYIGGATIFSVPEGRYAMTVHLIDWKAEPRSVGTDGNPSDSALPDFIVVLEPETAPGAAYRSILETFVRPESDG